MNIINMPQNVRTMTIEVTQETLVNFYTDFDSVAIRSTGIVGISEFSGKQIGDVGVLKCKANESVVYPNLIRKKYIYLIGQGTVEILVGNNLTINPFKNGAKGGDGKFLNYVDNNNGMIFILNKYVPEIDEKLTFKNTNISLTQGNSITVEICMNLSSDITRTERYVEFNTMDFILSDEYYNYEHWIEIALNGDHWYLSRTVTQTMNEDITLSLVLDDSSVSLYRNGTLIHSDSSATSALLPTTDVRYLYLMGGSQYNRSSAGNLYAFRFYNRALTVNEIAQNYAEDRKLLAFAKPVNTNN